MSDENLLRARQNCCRLCLAPDSECISILNSYAADKEPLATKIQNCVSIKISTNDRLSLRICHACISYLNSWQSFKNRCMSSQNKQRNWLDSDKRQQLLNNNVSISTVNATHEHEEHDDEQHLQQQHEQQSDLASSILDGITSLKKRKSLTVYPLPAVQIKDEPLDVDDGYGKNLDDSDEMVDPSLFLERTEEEGDEHLMDNSTFDYGHAITQQQHHQQQQAQQQRAKPSRSTYTGIISDVKEASCRACNLKFSTRANARRHERNLHPNLFELSTSTPNNTPITKPTPALAAALEMQRAAAAAAAVEASKSLISPQKYRQEVVNAFNKCEAGGFDYDNPEKYQHLLTDEKIVFLQQNEDFLKQYQSMTCRCCNKFYTTYKTFMQHMRKKYATLPRNLCFNCLKLNDSKALFISHLKRRNCINLYKVLHALMAKNSGFAAAVTATAAAAPEKLRAKELLVNKMYECKLCPKHFRLKLEFRSHVYEAHLDAQKKDELKPTQCTFCGLDIEDPAERKRHYNNMDCIVTLRCVTCDAKFSNHQQFLDHVYEQHLAGFEQTQQQQLLQQQQLRQQQQRLQQFGSDNASGQKSFDETRRSLVGTTTQATPKSQYFSRMPQACPICGQQYNNYNNVLRHMESKHPDQLPQTYKCVKCGIGYPRLSNLREHMVSAHEGDKTRHSGFEYIVNAEAVKITDGNAANVYTGRYDYVMKDLMSITNGGNAANDDDDDFGQFTKKPRLDNSAGDNNSNAGGSGNNSNVSSSLKECPICNAVFSNNIGLSNHMRSHTAAAAAVAAAHSTPRSLTITATGVGSGAAQQQSKTPAQQAIFRRSLEQAADRRFRRMRCRICQRRFSSKKSYRFHMLNDHQIRNVQFIKCKLCDAEFAYEKGLKVHMFKIHNTLLKTEMIIKQFECDICSIVYRTDEQLLQHKKTVHGTARRQGDEADVGADQSGISTPVSNVDSSTAAAASGTHVPAPLYWYQCKYCPSNFNTNKKLAIHINSHDEFDSHDYSCKDCGNVYSGRKSLWVHRYKKHPQIAEPSECVLCKKVFFDSQMLENHIPTCNRKPITATGALADPASSGVVQIYKHKTGDDDEEDEELSHDAADGIRAGTLGGGEVEVTVIPTTNMKIKLPEVACTMCGQRFTDQELFAKHIQMHEMELYTDNPLAAMFDTGPADPNQFYLDRVNDNGEYACDLCTKTFTQMTALKVHRKWHFRGDSKQNPADNEVTTSSQTLTSHPHLLGLQAVGLMPNPHPQAAGHLKSQKRKRELKCEYCPSTFISNNNLRRHIYELHKDVISNLPAPPKIKLDTPLRCRRCDLKFETKQEWIEHKVADARVTKPYGPFQWGCELCGAYVSRKEKLINHIHNHMKESEIVPAEQQQQNAENEKLQQQMQSRENPQATSLDETQAEDGEEEDDAKEEYEEEVLEDDGEGDGEGEGEVEGDGDDDEIDNDYEEVEGDVDYDEVEIVAEDDDETMAQEEHDVAHANENDSQSAEDVEMDEEDEDDEVEYTNDDDEDDEDDATNDAKLFVRPQNTTKTAARNSADTTTEAEDSPSYIGDDDDDEDDDDDGDGENDDDEVDDDDDADTRSSSGKQQTNTAAAIAAAAAAAKSRRYACDLCSVSFASQQELQKHVKMHFLNGPGSVTLTDIKPKSVKSQSRSSSSDVVTVSSS